MSEPVQPAPETPAAAPEQPAPEAELPKTYDQAYVDKLRAENASWRTKFREADERGKASMTEAERAVAEAEERGRTAVRTEYGQRLAQTEFRAAAAARNSDYDATKALQYVNLGAFVGEDGEPDSKAIAAAVADLIPEATNGATRPPSFDGGTRQPAQAGVSMSQLIRQATGRA